MSRWCPGVWAPLQYYTRAQHSPNPRTSFLYRSRWWHLGGLTQKHTYTELIHWHDRSAVMVDDIAVFTWSGMYKVFIICWYAWCKKEQCILPWLKKDVKSLQTERTREVYVSFLSASAAIVEDIALLVHIFLDRNRTCQYCLMPYEGLRNKCMWWKVLQELVP